MAAALFPKKRADGTFAAALEYRAAGAEGAIEAVVADWIRTKVEVGLVLSTEFTTPPYVTTVGPDVVRIVFDCTETASLWKGLMVDAHNAVQAATGLQQFGFRDLVADAFRPVSARGTVVGPEDGPPKT